MKNIIVGKCADWSINSNILEKHILFINNLMTKEFGRNSFSDKYFNLLEIRGITYLEYLQLFDQQIKEEDFLTYLPFLFLGVDTENGYYDSGKYLKGRKDYTHKYEPNRKGYFELLSSFPKFIKQIQQENIDAAIPYANMWEHSYINGASGSGKSTLIKGLIYEVSKTKESIILIDPQGKLASEVRAFKHLNNDRLVYIKPTLKAEFTPSINFLEKQKDTDANTLALRLARIISVISEGALSSPMISLLRPCLAVLIEKEDSSLSDLKRFLVKGENEDLVELGLQHSDSEYQSTFKRINTGYFNRTRDAIISKLDVVLQDKIFRNLTSGKSTIDIKQCIEQGKIIIFDLGGIDTDTIQAFGRLLVAMILNMALERKVINMTQTKRTFLFIDEMQNFLSPDVIKILDEARQKKLHLIMANQRIGQLKGHIQSNAEESFIDSIMGNTAIKIIGHNDSPDTLNVLSTKLGMDKEKLIGIPNYNFLLRVRGKKDVHFISSDAINDNHLYLSKEELEERDKYMLQQYYKAIPINSPTIKNAPKEKSTTKTISSIKEIILEEDDF